jgi:hypothetical protein
MQWQHGSFEKFANGSLILKPIKVDGRQLFSDPCQYKNSVYTRYNTTELFKVRFTSPSRPIVFQCTHLVSTRGRRNVTNTSQQQYTVSIDSYNKRKRLDLYQADGAPLMPLYLIYTDPPKMLPTTTLNPLVTATPGASKVKRDLPHEVLFKRTEGSTRADQWWWFGVLMTASGGLMYWFF